MKFEIMCKNTDSLHVVKAKLFKEIEMAFFLNLKKILTINDLSFSCKKNLVSKNLEEKTLETLFEEWVNFFCQILNNFIIQDPFKNSVVGNILSLEAFCQNKLKEYDLINSILIDTKLDSSEKMKEIIKFCNPSQKLVNKILVIAQDEHNLCLHLMKIYGEIKMSFPLEIIEGYTILKDANVDKFYESLNDFPSTNKLGRYDFGVFK